MSFYRIGHIALQVESLRQAESFYTCLFGLRVLFREGDSECGPVRLPASDSWEDARTAGWIVKRSFLGSGDFRLALHREVMDFAANARLDHICLWMEACALPSLRATASELGCRIRQGDSHCLVFEDLYGVRWKVTTPDRE